MPIMVDMIAPVTPVRPGVVEAVLPEPVPAPDEVEEPVPAVPAVEMVDPLSGVYEPPC